MDEKEVIQRFMSHSKMFQEANRIVSEFILYPTNSDSEVVCRIYEVIGKGFVANLSHYPKEDASMDAYMPSIGLQETPGKAINELLKIGRAHV